MKTLVLTGATGMVGSAIRMHFAARGWKVIAAVPPEEIHSVAPEDAVPFDLAADTLAPELERALAAASFVIHAAAILPSHIDEASRAAEQALFAANVAGTVRLAGAALQGGVPHVLQIGTTYDSDAIPTRLYKLSKWLGEKLVHEMARNTATAATTLRISAPYGPGWRTRAVIPVFLEKAAAGQDLELWGDGSREQTFTFTGDIARACELAWQARAAGVFTIAGPRPVTMRELAEAVLTAVPDSTSRIVMTGQRDPQEGQVRRISYAAAERTFGFRPMIDLQEGLSYTAAALRERAKT
jgi:UDP-glucose 4-epimerase